MTLPDRPVWRGATDAEEVSLLGGLYRYRAVGADTANAYTVFEVESEAGFAAPVHSHDHEAEGFYVLDGEVTIFIGDKAVTMSPGGFVLAPPHAPHAFRFDSPSAKLLLIVTPGDAGHEALFREMGEPASEERRGAVVGPDFGKLAEIAARHGTTMIGPPPAPTAGGR